MNYDEMKPGRELDAKPYRCRKCGGSEYKIYGKKEPRRVCIPCHKKNQRASYEKNKEKIAAQKKRDKPWQNKEFKEYQYGWKLESRYGISLDDYSKLLADQGDCCAICGGMANNGTKRLCVDHCHKSGRVRGLLCNKCNVGLANYEDDPDRLRAAAQYLETPPAALKATEAT